MTLAGLSTALASGRVGAVEALDAMVARVQALNPQINVVVAKDYERARIRAAKVDQARANGDRLAPLAGVPITIKDSLMTEGLTTTSGAPELADFVPDHDSAPVAALKGAGANVFAKTNLPIWAGDVQSYNEVYGTSNNPWDLTRSVGGSSGGSAGALAAEFTPIEVGSDIAGSIRNPAAMCGVVGHKPSYGIVSAKGQIPGPPGTLTQADIAVVGPMGRTAADCETALQILAGADDWHRSAWSLTLPPARTRTLDGLRVALWADDAYCPVDPQISGAINSLGEDLEANGAMVDAAARPVGVDFAKADQTFWNLLGGALSGGWSPGEIEQMARAEANGETTSGGLGVTGATMRHRGWLSNNERRLQMRERWRQFFEQYDVVLAPVSPTVAIPHDHSEPQSDRMIDVAGHQRPYHTQMQWMGLFGLAYLPATAVPIGVHSNGLPIGMQIVGPFLEDLTCLAAAHSIEQVTGGTRRPPGW